MKPTAQSEYRELLKRYEQLEQASKEMFYSMRSSMRRVKPIRMEEFHAALVDLEALGVSTDE